MTTDDDLPIIDSRHVFNIDYKNFQQVKLLAKKMGKGMSVIKHPDRPNYNIIHSSNEWRYSKVKIRILYRT